MQIGNPPSRSSARIRDETLENRIRRSGAEAHVSILANVNTPYNLVPSQFAIQEEPAYPEDLRN